VPQARATVVTIRTTIVPANRTTTHALVIGESVARSTDEAGIWRLFDFQGNRVTFVDDVAKTYRVVPLSTLIQDRRAINNRETTPAYPAAQFEHTGEAQTILATETRQAIVRMGNYEREIWFGNHPRIPANLFALMLASESRPTTFGQVAKELDEGLLAVRGFPLLDHAELPYGKEMMVVDRNVLRIEQREVPASLLEVPRGYGEVKVPAASRRPVLSRPPDQTAPEAGSPPSATTRTDP
jgi:hypothetical protein